MGDSVMRDSTVRSHYESAERAITAMRTGLDRPMTLRQLARIGFASPYHFNRTFRQVTGVPPLQFFYALRLDAAKRMLTETQKKVIDICYEVGYRSVGTFTRRFANVLGVPPVRYRKLTNGRNRPASRKKIYGSTIQNGYSGASVAGNVSTPRNFDGYVAVGLFTTRIPQGKPIACTVIKGSGVYQMDDAPEGDFYLFAVALESPPDLSVYFDYGSAMRAGGQRIRIHGSSVQGRTTLELRPPSPFDPPLLFMLSAQDVSYHLPKF
ncbi:MAG: AraC family transcriptional regulator [Candidatus Angelobacter sp.]